MYFAEQSIIHSNSRLSWVCGCPSWSSFFKRSGAIRTLTRKNVDTQTPPFARTWSCYKHPAQHLGLLPSPWDYCPAPKWSHYSPSVPAETELSFKVCTVGPESSRRCFLQTQLQLLAFNNNSFEHLFIICSAKPFTITHFSKGLSHTQVTAVCLVPKPVLNHYVEPLRDVTQHQLKGSKALPYLEVSPSKQPKNVFPGSMSMPPTPEELGATGSSVWSESFHGFRRTSVGPKWQCSLLDLSTFLVLIYFPDLQVILQITFGLAFLDRLPSSFFKNLVLQKFLSLQ